MAPCRAPGSGTGGRPARADVKPEHLRQFPADRHLATFRSLAAHYDDHALRQTDILDAQTRELGNVQAGFQQCLKQQARCAARLVGMVASSATLALNSAENRLRVFIVNRLSHQSIHLKPLSQKPEPPQFC